jgi:hypothetical protein
MQFLRRDLGCLVGRILFFNSGTHDSNLTKVKYPFYQCGSGFMACHSLYGPSRASVWPRAWWVDRSPVMNQHTPALGWNMHVYVLKLMQLCLLSTISKLIALYLQNLSQSRWIMNGSLHTVKNARFLITLACPTSLNCSLYT